MPPTMAEMNRRAAPAGVPPLPPPTPLPAAAWCLRFRCCRLRVPCSAATAVGAAVAWPRADFSSGSARWRWMAS
jgi:hypothetical protein